MVTPTRRDLFELFAAALLLRVLIFVVASVAFDIPPSAYTDKGDGLSYKRYAIAILGDASAMTSYDTRVFPGYPAMIAMLRLVGVPIEAGALAIDFACAGFVAALAARLFDDRRVGWAAAMLIPHWPINSSLAMSEAPMLALALGGACLAIRSERVVLGAILLGAAGLTRPVACFAAFGVLAALLPERRRDAIAFACACGGVVMGGIVALHEWTGDAFSGVRVYANDPGAYRGELFLWPFESLVRTPLRGSVSAGRIIYIYAHVLLTLGACGIIAWRARADRRPIDRLAAAWLLGNTLFVLCIGSDWGFNHFPRFTIPAMPALWFALRRMLPRDRWPWLVVAIPVGALAVFGVRASP